MECGIVGVSCSRWNLEYAIILGVVNECGIWNRTTYLTLPLCLPNIWYVCAICVVVCCLLRNVECVVTAVYLSEVVTDLLSAAVATPVQDTLTPPCVTAV